MSEPCHIKGSFYVAPQGHFLRGVNLGTSRALPQECYRIPSGSVPRAKHGVGSAKACNTPLLPAVCALNLPFILQGSATIYFVQNKSEAPWNMTTISQFSASLWRVSFFWEFACGQVCLR